MSVKYYKEDDLLAIRLSTKQFKAAEGVGSFIIHYDDKHNPVYLEILNASKLLKQTSKALPQNLRQQLFATA